MEFPPDMPEELREILTKVMGGSSEKGESRKCKEGDCEHQQVVKFEGDALLTFKTFRSNTDRLARKLRTLQAECGLIDQQGNKAYHDFWEWVYEKYGLSSRPSYHFTEDGRIFLRQNSEDD